MVKDKWDGIIKKRTSLMGAFHRLDILLTQDVYEFCDLFIKRGLEYTTDEDIKEKFNSYIDERRFINMHTNHNDAS
jgi:hypothetical protein